MARFDLYRNPGTHQASTPYLLDVQSNHLAALSTRIVIPLRRVDRFPEVALPKDLIPVFVVEGVECLLDAPRLAAVPQNELQHRVGTLAADREAIVAALDRLFGAY